jgi:glutaredoxin
MVILYSTGCPKCKVLEQKLRDKGIEFEVENDIEVMIDKGYTMAPVLVVDGKEYEFGEAVKWVNESGVGV